MEELSNIATESNISESESNEQVNTNSSPSHPSPNKFGEIKEKVDELKQKRKHLNTLQQYKLKFPESFLGYEDKMMNAVNLTSEELEDFIAEIRLATQQSTSSDLIRSSVLGATLFLEKTSSKIGYNLTGLHAIVSNEKSIIRCIDELSLEFGGSTFIPAYYRLPILMVQQIFLVHGINEKKKIIDQEVKKKLVPQATLDKYKDL